MAQELGYVVFSAKVVFQKQKSLTSLNIHLLIFQMYNTNSKYNMDAEHVHTLNI